MTTDRRAVYYIRSAHERAADELAWLHRIMRGLSVKRMVRMGKQAKQPANVLTMKRKTVAR